MIKAEELRIGNLVNLFKGITDEGPEYETYQISSGFDLYKLDENNCDDIQPIPLSEEWLLKMGFEKKYWESEGVVIKCYYYEKDGVVIYLISKGFEIEIKHNEGQFNLFKVWQYVHQLQNIFFSLTGEELTIKN